MYTQKPIMCRPLLSMLNPFSNYVHRKTFEIKTGYRWSWKDEENGEFEPESTRFMLVEIGDHPYYEWANKTFCCKKLINSFEKKLVRAENCMWVIRDEKGWPVIKSIKFCPHCGSKMPPLDGEDKMIEFLSKRP